MLKKTITYTDYNGLERTENFYFNLTETEIMEMEVGTVGGLAEMITKVVEAKDAPAIMKTFKDLLLKAYGEKSLDGKRFEKKNGQLAEAFAETEAYSILFMELVTDAEKAAEFINGIVPANLQQNNAALEVIK